MDSLYLYQVFHMWIRKKKSEYLYSSIDMAT